MTEPIEAVGSVSNNTNPYVAAHQAQGSGHVHEAKASSSTDDATTQIEDQLDMNKAEAAKFLQNILNEIVNRIKDDSSHMKEALDKIKQVAESGGA